MGNRVLNMESTCVFLSLFLFVAKTGVLIFVCGMADSPLLTTLLLCAAYYMCIVKISADLKTVFCLQKECGHSMIN